MWLHAALNSGRNGHRASSAEDLLLRQKQNGPLVGPFFFWRGVVEKVSGKPVAIQSYCRSDGTICSKPGTKPWDVAQEWID